MHNIFMFIKKGTGYKIRNNRLPWKNSTFYPAPTEPGIQMLSKSLLDGWMYRWMHR